MKPLKKIWGQVDFVGCHKISRQCVLHVYSKHILWDYLNISVHVIPWKSQQKHTCISLSCSCCILWEFFKWVSKSLFLSRRVLPNSAASCKSENDEKWWLSFNKLPPSTITGYSIFQLFSDLVSSSCFPVLLLRAHHGMRYFWHIISC